MDLELEGILDRANELRDELQAEYKDCLRAREVSERARNLSHEVLEKLRSVLDQTVHRAWEKYIAPDLTDKQRRTARVYFPITPDRRAFDAALGRAHMTDLGRTHSEFYDLLLKHQPFQSKENLWLGRLGNIANEGKHVRLTPQKRVETRRITVQGAGGSVSWGPSAVRFGEGVSIMGAPVDPETQRIIPTPGVTEREERWVSFIFEGYGVDALGFCREACRKTRGLVEEMVNLLSL